ncbi:MAG: type II toxin-antitoxin system ParD family antitoxin [Gemmatales bacterium]
MDTINISMPKIMKDYVQERVKTGGYGNTSEYVRDLIRAEQKQRAREEFEALVIEGIQSGPATPLTSDDWAQLRERVQKRATRKR